MQSAVNCDINIIIILFGVAHQSRTPGCVVERRARARGGL